MERERNKTDRLETLYKKVKNLQKIDTIINYCLTHGSYSDGNMELQLKRLEEKNVPEWEQKILISAYEYRKKHSHELWNEIQEYIKELKEG